jgi:hypothetical protein
MPSEPHSDLIESKTQLGKHSDTYMINTHFLNDFNEIHNSNEYLNNKTLYETQRLEGINDKLRATILKMKQELLLKRYTTEDYRVKTSILYASIVVACFLLILLIFYTKDELGKRLLTILSAIIIALFLTFVYLTVRYNSYRVETDWNKYYWGPLEKKKS